MQSTSGRRGTFSPFHFHPPDGRLPRSRGDLLPRSGSGSRRQRSPFYPAQFGEPTCESPARGPNSTPSKLCGWVMSSRTLTDSAAVPFVRFLRLDRLRLEPLDDLAAGRLPDALMGADVAKHLVEMPDAPRLAHDPRMQMEYHQASGGRAIGVQAIEPVAPQQVDLVDGPAAVEVDVVVVE